MENLCFSLWLEALLDARASFDVSLVGLSGRLRMPPAWSVERGLPDEHLFYLVAEGGFRAKWGGETRTMGTGDLVWVGCATPFHFWLPPDENLLVWRFRLRALDAQNEALPNIEPLWHVSPARGCERWMEEIIDETSTTAPYNAVRLRGLLLCLLTDLMRAATEAPATAGVLTRQQREILNHYLASHARHWPAPSELARLLDMSPDYFTRCFRRTYGVPPRRYLMEERLRFAAMHLLESNGSISQIARELGYDDVFLFSRQFKAMHGLSPAHYRREHGAVAQL